MRRPLPLADRLSRLTLKVDGSCWIWQGRKTPKGYGLLKMPGDTWARAHRLVYEVYVGQIPSGMLVCHRCDMPSCVRPDHLFIGTAKDNVHDMMRKGRGRWPGPSQPRRGESNHSAKLTAAQVEEARALYGNGGSIGMKALARKYGVAWQTIQKLLSGHSWGGPKRVFSNPESGGRPAGSR